MNSTIRILFLFFCSCIISLVIWGIVSLESKMAVQTSTVVEASKPIVVIDAGHGGFDGGAQGNGINEKVINLIISKKLQYVSSLFGYDCVMTRSADISIEDEQMRTVRERKRSDIKNRLKTMTKDPKSITISIHLNKYPSESVHGAQVFYAPFSQNSDILAQTIQTNIRNLLQTENKRQIKRADKNLFILYNNTTTPAVIVECGFLSNPNEAEKLKNENYQSKLALAIFKSMIEFQNGEDVA